MNIKAKKAKVQPLSKKSVINVLSQDEIKKKVQVIEQELKMHPEKYAMKQLKS